MTRSTFRRVRAVALAGVLALAMAACGGGSTGGTGDSAGETAAPPAGGTDVQAALRKGGELKIWAWETSLKQVVVDFQKKYPNVKVELVNAGTGNDQYTALLNAITAGSGVPDVAQIEYFALPQFALSKGLAELSPFGAGSLDGTFTPGPWNAVKQSGGIYGLPMDSGPMALFYNKKVFDKHKIEVPTTWDEYVQAAKALHAADPKVYITSDTGDAGFTTSLIWQAGGRPYKVDGTNVTIDFSDAGVARVAATWQQLLDADLVAPITGWTDEWYKGLADGTIATLAVGAWMPANFSSGVAAASGDWRVAPLPQWQAGSTVSAENGGSSLTVPQAGTNQALAYGFLDYAAAREGVQTRISQGAFPATSADLKSEKFLSTEFDYFDGQKANEIFAQSAANVASGWSYLPFQVYANSIFNDTVGQAYVDKTTIADGLKTWRDASVKYGADQGFTVK
ncbi:ABC transporter substrate-binding protein [Streptosporangium sp. KLBMP 9127]|nr:sugar ABC transporter substrate-binding protein [Streptosporangium sp. KLBMP 9127]